MSIPGLTIIAESINDSVPSTHKLFEENDIAIKPIFSMGRSMKAWHFITSPSARKEDLPYPMEALLGIKQQILNKTRDLTEDAFCSFARKIFNKKERNLIPALVALLENLNSEKAIALLEEYAEDKTSPLVRDYCHLALFRMRQEKDGGKYISQELAEKMAVSFDKGQQALPHENLSDREYQIMCAIATGQSAESIANDLSISVHTVYSYRNRILEKLALKTNVEITQYAIKNKLIEL